MSKIVQAVNAMLSNASLITDVVEGDNEIFFLYKGKYKWSIAKRQDEYSLWFYPSTTNSVHDLAEFTPTQWQSTKMVRYQTLEIGTREAKATFADLYTLVGEKLYGLDQVLDEIISDDEL